jgi:hypothetical protein
MRKKKNVENYVQLLFNWVRTNHDVDHKPITEERETCAFVFVSSMSVCSLPSGPVRHRGKTGADFCSKMSWTLGW